MNSQSYLKLFKFLKNQKNYTLPILYSIEEDFEQLEGFLKIENDVFTYLSKDLEILESFSNKFGIYNEFEDFEGVCESFSILFQEIPIEKDYKNTNYFYDVVKDKKEKGKECVFYSEESKEFEYGLLFITDCDWDYREKFVYLYERCVENNAKEDFVDCKVLGYDIPDAFEKLLERFKEFCKDNQINFL